MQMPRNSVLPDGAKVSRLRSREGLSQQQLADKAGYSLKTIVRIEAGKPTTAATLRDVAKVLEVDKVEELFAQEMARSADPDPPLPVPTSSAPPQPATAIPKPGPPARRTAGRDGVGARFEDHAFAAQSVVASYPAPVALPYQRFARQKEPVPRVLALFQAAEALVRYLTILGLADLFRCLADSGVPDAALPADERFDFLRRKTNMFFGTWLAALRATAAALDGQPGRLLNELPRVCAPGGHFDAQLLGGIVEERNRWTHPDGNIVITADEAEDVLPRLRPRLEAALSEAGFVRRYPLGFFQRYTPEGVTPPVFALYSGMGTRFDNRGEAYKFQGTEVLPEGVPFVATPDGRGLLTLWPLLLQRVSPVSGRHTLYTFEMLADRKRPWLARVHASAIDVRDDVWYEDAHPGPGAPADHGWLLRHLREQAAAAQLPAGFDLAQRLLGDRRQLAGKRLGSYTLCHVLATGGFGTIYLANDAAGACVAVKVFESDAVHQFARFEREFDKLRQASHPRIVRCYCKGRDVVEGTFYQWYAMEFAVGGDLTGRIADRGPDPWADPDRRAAVVRDFRDIVEAVVHLHGLGIIHRDLKPGNVLVMDEGELRLADFGLAKALVPSQTCLTSDGAVLGTPDYMAPEQRGGCEADERADVYALGVVLAELATGRHPRPRPDTHQGSTLNRFEALDTLPTPLRRFILRCTDVTLSERPANAREVLDRFHEAVKAAGESVDARRLPLPKPLPSNDAAPVGGGPRPAPLDCTGEAGVSEEDVQKAQAAWARYLGRQVEEQDEIAPGVKMAFVLVPPGKFLMGSPPAEIDDLLRQFPDAKREWFADELQHEVTLTEPFYLGKCAVTQAQYEALLGRDKNPSHFKGADLPVESVTWTQAAEYADSLTTKRAAKLLYRLPTEAEWEYSCRGGRSSSKPFGIGDGNSLSSDQANFDGSFPYGGAAPGKYLEKPSPVGSYLPNAFGLHGMHGNVWEWCADWYGLYPAGNVINPGGPPEGSSRVIRGGSWGSYARRCRAAGRYGIEPGDRLDDLGFRLARVPSGQ
jgi:formylglycine-generating enzyme required for sulfatase activity/DNA-binding XRE family transcriptional regulator